MITKATALILKHKTIVHSTDGCATKITKWRVNGECQTWKREPLRFRLPIKFGLYLFWEINECNCYLFHLEDDCPALQGTAKQASFGYEGIS